MELMTQELLKEFEKVGRQEQNPDPIVVAKYFSPVGKATWLATEFYPEEGLFFGYVSLFNDPFCNELGYFSLDELQEIRIKPFGLGIERDLYFDPAPLSVVKKRERIH